MTQSRRPALAAPRAPTTLEAGWNPSSGQWDAEAWVVMNGRDDALIADEILHGATSDKFLYQFEIKGTAVVGISVVGARYLAYHYGGLKHRIVATIQKTAELFTFTTYPHEGQPMGVHCSTIRELADQPDFFQAVVEVTDTHTGNSVQVEKREYRFDRDRNGREYEKPHYSALAQSKALRNAYLGLIPTDVQLRWRNQMVKDDKKMVDITGSVIEEKRAGVLRFAAKQGLLLDRRAVEDLTLDQIAGLGDAARDENQMAFVNAARALQLDVKLGDGEEEAEVPQQNLAQTQQQADTAQPAEQRRRGRPPKAQQQAEQPKQEQQADQREPNEPPFGEAEEAAQQAQEKLSEQPQTVQHQPQAQPRQPAPAQPSRGAMLNFC